LIIVSQSIIVNCIFIKIKPVKRYLAFIIIAIVGIIAAAIIIFFNYTQLISMKYNNLIPRKVLFGNPDKVSVSISPDGQRIGYLSEREGVLNIYIADRVHPNKAIPITNDKKRGVRNYVWTHDNKHILYLQDKDGDEDYHIYKVNINTLKVKDLTPFKKTRSFIAKLSERIPNRIVIGVNNRDPRYFDLYEADLVSGKLQLMHENKEELIEQIISDYDGEYRLRFATKVNDDGSQTIYSVKENLKLEPFLEIPIEDYGRTHVIGFGETSDIVYISNALGRDTNALVKYNQRNKTNEIIYHDKKTDIDNVLFKPHKRTPQILYNTFLRRTERLLDNDIKADIKHLNDFDKEGELYIVSRDINDQYWIIGYLSDRKPFSYYLYSRKTMKVKFLFKDRKKLENYNLAPMLPLIIKSRDGLDLVSYLTLPFKVSNKKDKNFVPTKPVPLVLVVHGGPKGIRDNWGLNNIHQWLANRGYAVLAVNYRASGGFGKKFLNAGDGEWSKKMHYDLLDAVDWAINNKITTKDKVSIFGGSYGGYAALVGVTFTPDVFACAIDIVGPSNLITLVRSIPKYWASFYKRLLRMLGGDPDTKEGRKFLLSISPLTYVKNIKKPLLIAQGANDPRVKQAESDQIVNAMKKNRIPVTYLLYPDEGHGFARPENRMSFYAVAEQFLAKNLGGRTEPIDKAFKGSSVKVLEGKK
jgi:dipeptidyl aminopeptidase/acylaminoacyl peptidase